MIHSDDLWLLLEVLEAQRVLLEQIANALETSRWSCGCGHVNGCNLAVCGTCGRSPGAPQ
ncbi:hypothetical protein LCGC14_0723090 [marine sediment metagenome]|uniref:Uncharacterized protein n=1 Tax=marine sediment metagenome TaxID=412755 RepID=A0A0F9TJ19_9ZZZZ